MSKTGNTEIQETNDDNYNLHDTANVASSDESIITTTQRNIVTYSSDNNTIDEDSVTNNCTEKVRKINVFFLLTKLTKATISNIYFL